MQDKLQFKFGIISDVQYADIKDGHSFRGVPRYYRASLEGLKRGVTAWQQQQVEFAVQYGDAIDGFNPKDQSETAMQSVLQAFSELQKPVHHIIGNHDLYNLPRQRLNEVLGIQGHTASYYSFSPHEAWRFLVLDGYDVSMLGWPEGHPAHTQAKQILDEKNVNEVSLCDLLSGCALAGSMTVPSQHVAHHKPDDSVVLYLRRAGATMHAGPEPFMGAGLLLVTLPAAASYCFTLFMCGKNCCACRTRTTQTITREWLAGLSCLAGASAVSSSHG